MANLSNINNKFLVTTGGDVGIGVTGPTSKLQVGPGTSNADRSLIASLGGTENGVLSALSLVNTSGNDVIGYGVGIDFHLASTYSPTGRIATIAEDTSVKAGMAFYTYESGGLDERMRIDSSGNVTIGTGVINPSIGSDIAITQGSIGLRINDAASALSPTTATSNNDNAVDLGVSNIRFRNLYMGGTGTFGGNVTVNSGNKLILNRTDNAIASELSSSSTGKLILNSLNGEGFDLQNNGTSILLGDSSGNVGLGDIPSFKLDVNVTSDRARFKTWYIS